MKIFRKLRVSAILENKVTKYLLYAIGEILLVTIGILIAVQINNSNENRKQNEALDSIYKTVASDLAADTLRLAVFIDNYEKIDSVIHLVLNQTEPLVDIDTINEVNVEECFPCMPLHANHVPFSPTQAGFESLKRFANNTDQIQDSLTFDIIQFYKEKIEIIEFESDQLGAMILDNVLDLEQYSWYKDFTYGIFNKDCVNYFLNNKEYKNKLSSFRLIAIKNYLRDLKGFTEGGRKLIEEIKKET